MEIAKALSLRARLLILDEPTSSLTTAETDRLLAVVDRLRSEGVAIILISHRLGEVERLPTACWCCGTAGWSRSYRARRSRPQR